MATDRYFTCETCGEEEWAGRLFDALRRRSCGDPTACQCGGQRHLKVSFPFGLGAGLFTCKIVGAFVPEWDIEWEDGAGGNVAFYPFLIVCEPFESGRKQTAWLPYWHVVTYADGRSPQTKYGQWAPHMDADILVNLVDQARRAGLLASN